VRKQTVLITGWLLFPIVVMAGLMVWIFVSLDRERLMDDAPAIGAGAGDTGNANALGIWLSGRDPDAVARALRARREGVAIDPALWPGGMRVRVPARVFGEPEDGVVFEPLIVAIDHERGAMSSAALLPDGDGALSGVIDFGDAVDRFVYLSSGPVRIDGDALIGPDGARLSPLDILPVIPAKDLDPSDPIPVIFE
jgi:hypothetical protein